MAVPTATIFQHRFPEHLIEAGLIASAPAGPSLFVKKHLLVQRAFGGRLGRGVRREFRLVCDGA
jgi:hypothetical protein